MAETIQVGIVTFNNATTITECLRSVVDDVDVRTEVTVVDNGSGDATTEVVHREFPGVELIASGGNIGFGAACNLVLRRCRARYVLLLNPDAALRPGSLGLLLDRLAGEARTALVGPRVEYHGGRPQVSFGPFPAPIADLVQRRRVNGCRRRNTRTLNRVERQLRKSFLADWISGACMLAKTAALSEVEFFDERFFLYLEDVDLCRRLRARGWHARVVPEARCTHHEGASHGDTDDIRLHFRRSRLLYENKHGSRLAFAAYRLLRGADTGIDYDPELRWKP